MKSSILVLGLFFSVNAIAQSDLPQFEINLSVPEKMRCSDEKAPAVTVTVHENPENKGIQILHFSYFLTRLSGGAQYRSGYLDLNFGKAIGNDQDKQQQIELSQLSPGTYYLTVTLRYKDPSSDPSTTIEMRPQIKVDIFPPEMAVMARDRVYKINDRSAGVDLLLQSGQLMPTLIEGLYTDEKRNWVLGAQNTTNSVFPKGKDTVISKEIGGASWKSPGLYTMKVSALWGPGCSIDRLAPVRVIEEVNSQENEAESNPGNNPADDKNLIDEVAPKK